jgi:Tfp pilus assembly protein PilP
MRWRTCGGLGLVLLLVPIEAAHAGPPTAESARAVEPADEPPYDSGGRRDPFRPPRVAPGTVTGEARTPLERYELGQLHLVAIIYDTHEPRAVVEDEEGLGYIVHVGTRIGPNGGQVAMIERGKVMVREDSVDFYGEHHPAEVALELKTPERPRVGERGKR